MMVLCLQVGSWGKATDGSDGIVLGSIEDKNRIYGPDPKIIHSRVG